MEQNLRAKLRKDWELLRRSVTALQPSMTKCERIGIKPEYNFEESESFDSLTSKFARTSDIFTQKVLKTVFLLLREEAETFIDRMNMAEKLGLFSSSDEVIQIRDLRNSISHEYEEEDIRKIYANTLKLAPILISAVESSGQFLKSRDLLFPDGPR